MREDKGPRLNDQPDERLRLEELARYQILDTPADEEFDELATLAAEACDAPVAMVSFVDEMRQWFKARVGMERSETPREHSFCSVAIRSEGVMVVEDAAADERFRDNPLVLGHPHVRFYAGVPLISRRGYPLGTLCVIDQRARSLTGAQRRTLETLGRAVTRLLDYQLANRALVEERSAQIQLDTVLAHDLRSPFSGLLSLSRELEKTADHASIEEVRADARMVRQSAEGALSLVENLLAWSQDRSGLDAPRRTVVCLRQLANEVCLHLRPQAADKGVVIETRFPQSALFPVDDRVVTTVLRNLISNAIKFSPPGGVVKVALSLTPSEEPQFAVTDSGAGIPAAVLERVSKELPVTPARGTSKEKGSGLGLVLCRRLLRKLGSHLEVGRAPGGGSTIGFTIPRKRDRVVAAEGLSRNPCQDAAWLPSGLG